MLSHVVRASGSSKLDIANVLLFFAKKKKKECYLDNLKIIGLDGTFVDLGWRSEFVRRLEKSMQSLLLCL